MKNVPLLCLLCVLLPSVGAVNITCASCDLGDTKCAGKTCSAEKCVSLTEKNTLGANVNATGTYRGCLNQCKPRAFTFTTSTKRSVQASSACCISDKCNENLTLSVPPVSTSENGVSCPVCENYNQSQCASQTHITCTGIENKCISLTGISIANEKVNFSIRACATQSACDLAADDLVPYSGNVYKLTKKPVCTNAGVLGAISSQATFLSAIIGILLLNVLS